MNMIEDKLLPDEPPYNQKDINLIETLKKGANCELVLSDGEASGKSELVANEKREEIKPACSFICICLLFFLTKLAQTSSYEGIIFSFTRKTDDVSAASELKQYCFISNIFSYIPRIIFSICAGYFSDYDSDKTIINYSTIVGFIGNFILISSTYIHLDNTKEKNQKLFYPSVATLISDIGYTSLYVIVLHDVIREFYNKKLGTRIAVLTALFSLEHLICNLIKLNQDTSDLMNSFFVISIVCSFLLIIIGIYYSCKFPVSNVSSSSPIDKETCGTQLNKIINSRFFIISFNWGILMSTFNTWELCLGFDDFYNYLFPQETGNFKKGLLKLFPFIGILIAVIVLLCFKFYQMRSKTPFMILSSFIAGTSSWALLVLLINKDAEKNLLFWILTCILIIMGAGFGILMVVGFTCIPPLNIIYHWGLSAGFFVAVENCLDLVQFELYYNLILGKKENVEAEYYTLKSGNMTENLTNQNFQNNNNLIILIAITSVMVLISTVLYIYLEILDSNIRSKKLGNSLYVSLEEQNYSVLSGSVTSTNRYCCNQSITM